jgi:pimeloyl-ACP methyl ester carboxylesterase
LIASSAQLSKSPAFATPALISNMTAKSRKSLLLLLAATTAGLALYNNLLARRALDARLLGRFIYLGGTKLHFLEAGNGQPLLLLHGNGASAEDFTTSGIFDRAAARYRVLAFDRPGFGMSPRPAGRPWTAAAQADLIDAAVAKLGIERYMVVGHSLGGDRRARDGASASPICCRGCRRRWLSLPTAKTGACHLRVAGGSVDRDGVAPHRAAFAGQAELALGDEEDFSSGNDRDPFRDYDKRVGEPALAAAIPLR